MANSPIDIEMELDIDAPIEDVWFLLVDWENLGSWMLEGSNFKVISAQREGVGTKAQTDIKIMGIKTRDPIEVTRWEPPNLLEVQHLGWVKGSGVIECSQTATGTAVHWTETLVPPWGIVGAIGMRLFVPIMRKVFERDLRMLKRLAESRGR